MRCANGHTCVDGRRKGDTCCERNTITFAAGTTVSFVKDTPGDSLMTAQDSVGCSMGEAIESFTNLSAAGNRGRHKLKLNDHRRKSSDAHPAAAVRRRRTSFCLRQCRRGHACGQSKDAAVEYGIGGNHHVRE